MVNRGIDQKGNFIFKIHSSNLEPTSENLVHHTEAVGHAVAQLVEALRYKPEGRGFDS